MRILKVPTGTNFKLEPKHAQRIRQLWEQRRKKLEQKNRGLILFSYFLKGYGYDGHRKFFIFIFPLPLFLNLAAIKYHGMG